MVETAAGTLKRVVAIRLTPGEDLLGGITEACERYGIKNGVILSGIGSLQKARFFDPAVLPETKFGYGYSDPIEVEGPIELIAVSGQICAGEKGEVLLHVHCCYADEHGTAYAGHLIEGNKILMTADLTIGEFEGIYMDRRYEEDYGVYLVHPTQI